MDGDTVAALGLEWTGPAPLATTLAALEKAPSATFVRARPKCGPPSDAVATELFDAWRLPGPQPGVCAEDAATGAITTAVALDHETTQQYTFGVDHHGRTARALARPKRTTRAA